MSVERVYQKKTQLEHILLRPDTYIGSVEPVTQVRLGSVMSLVPMFSLLLAVFKVQMSWRTIK